MTSRLGLLGAFLFLLPACEATVAVDRDEDECGPKPARGGWCPPAWECVDGEWVDQAGACPYPACPSNEPDTGDACEAIGQECAYTTEEPCGPVTDITYTCTGTGWKTAINACQPEPTCPLEMPIVGSDCSQWEYPYFCQYGAICGEEVNDVTMSCDYTTDPPSWQLDSEPSECQPCAFALSAASCEATAGCRWLVPGCGEAPPIAEGCYPADDCQRTGCEPEQTCTLFDTNPCWNELCDACSSPVGICTGND